MKTKQCLFVVLIMLLSALACALPGPTAPTQEMPVAVTVPVQTEEISAPAELPPEILPSLEIDKSLYQPGAVISIRFTAPEDFAPDAWIGLVPSGTPHGSGAENDEVDLEFEHIDGRTEGIVLFNAPQEGGSYDIRMFDSDNDGQEAVSITFEVPAAPAAPPDVTCNGVSFSFDDSLATSVSCEEIAADPGSPDSPYWDVNPAYLKMTFEGYPLQNTFHMPQIFVYPVAEYESMSEGARQKIADLRVLLENRPENPAAIPLLPIFNAAQMMRSKVLYADFHNGRGVRFLTQYGQAVYPINNHSLFYTFQGITNDGQYYVAAFFPVNHPDLPPDGNEVPNGDWDAFSNNFESYLSEIQVSLNEKQNGSFQPSLELLDQLIQSLSVE